MTTTSWPAEFEQLVRPHLSFLSGDEALGPEQTLFELGLNSLSLVILLVELEEKFNVSFPEDLLVYEAFSTAISLWTAVAALREEAGYTSPAP